MNYTRNTIVNYSNTTVMNFNGPVRSKGFALKLTLLRNIVYLVNSNHAYDDSKTLAR